MDRSEAERVIREQLAGYQPAAGYKPAPQI